MLKKSIRNYNFEMSVVNYVEQFDDLIEDHDLKKINNALADLTFSILQLIQAKKIKPEIADRIYMLLSIFFEDNLPELDENQDAHDLLFEGNILHDLGKDYGADLKLMEDLANKLKKQD